MNSDVVNFGPTIRLTPHSGLQFVEYAFNIDEVDKIARRFIERELDQSEWIEGKPTFRLVPTWSEDDQTDDETIKPRDKDHEYTIKERQALEMFLEKWVPVPVLRVKAGLDGSPEFDHGPTNWARVRVIEIPDRSKDSPYSHRVVFAFDTELLERRPNRPYVAPSLENAANEHEFRMAHRFNDLAWFLGAPAEGDPSGEAAGFQSWVPAWLMEMFREFKQAQRKGRPPRDEEIREPLEHYARYAVFLEYLQKAVNPREIRFIDTVSASPVTKPVLVDLILDVGNSRTCGILIESHPNEDVVDLNNSFVLGLRDLSQPERTYVEPFESHVELSQAKFGRDNLSVKSTRARAFFWPSAVRVGPEAARFRQLIQGNEAVTGLSSPKRYLCDVRAVNQEWRFPEGDYGPTNTSPLIDRAIRQFLNTRGDVIEQLDADGKRYGFRINPDDRIGAQRLSFSRSSFFTLMVAEIICHAWSQINDPAVREKRRTKDAPRKLRRIIMTLPPAMPVQEQRLLRSRAEGAVRLIWKLMGWADNPPPGITRPEIHVAWDEASCVQFVYLYGEITQKLGGQIEGFMHLLGRPRAFHEPEQVPAPGTRAEPSIRIASIDIGGGTTDLMITTYYSEGNRAIKPTQNFREGFRIAGDDVLKAVIERLVLPSIERSLTEAGHPDARSFLLERFGGDRANMAEQEKHLRRQFVARVLQPIALRILTDAEEAEDEAGVVRSRAFAEFFPAPEGKSQASPKPDRRLCEFIEQPARSMCREAFALENCVFTSDLSMVDRCVRSVLDNVFDNLCEVIHEFDCDVVLLSGRPTRLPAVVKLFLNQLAVSPERVVPMHQYQAGNWYPFRARDNRRIGDPKTTTAVGGMLCALAESQLTNFYMFTQRLGLRSTAKYIGELETDGRLKEEKTFFREIDLDQKGGDGLTSTFKYWAPMRIGYRQLPVERWIATPLYWLRLQAGADPNKIGIPIEITLERSDASDIDDDRPDALIKQESTKEEFTVVEATDRNGVDVRKSLDLILHTLDKEQAYWLDTGILIVG